MGHEHLPVIAGFSSSVFAEHSEEFQGILCIWKQSSMNQQCIHTATPQLIHPHLD